MAKKRRVFEFGLVALSALVSLSCGSPAETPPSTPSASSAAVTPSATASSGASPPSAPVEAHGGAAEPSARRRPTRDDGTRARRAVAEGRGLVANGDPVAALARFEEALVLAPTARLRCEAGYVAFRARELERADQLVSEALVVLLPGSDPPASLRAPTAMCLYNAGLVHEARGRPDEARAAYARSLALRHNRAVEAHLVALGAAPRAERPPWATLPAATTSFDALASAIRTDQCMSRDPDGCDPPAVQVVAGAPPGLEGALLSMEQLHPGCTRSVFDVLAVRAGDRFLVAELDTTCVEDNHGWEAPHSIGGRYDDVLPGGAPELVVTVEITGGDEPTDWRTFEWLARRTIVCTLDLGPLACIWLAPASGSSNSESLEDTEAGADLDEPTYAGYATTLTLVGGRAVFTRDPRYPDPAPPDAELRPLFAGAIGRWPDDWDPVD